MKIFFDSSFLIAYLLENDSLHEKAFNLEKEDIFNNNCYISSFIINEVITVIGNKTDNEVAKYAYYFLIDNFELLNECDYPYFNDNTFEIYLEYDTKLSFTDSGILELMFKNNINKLVSFDKYFDKVENIERIH